MDIKNRWQQIQDQEYEHGQEVYSRTGSYFGFFSVSRFAVTDDIANRLAQIDGPVLDIGCGLLPMPNYLKKCQNQYGIDPYLGKVRQFPFAQAIGESLPFANGTFAVALLMSSLDHAIEPARMIQEARRVLFDGGLLFVWYTRRNKPDAHHQWIMSRDYVSSLARGFIEVDFVEYGANRQVGYPRTEMIIFEKVQLYD